MSVKCDCDLYKECSKCGKYQPRWTQFFDIHSGGGAKRNFELCFIQAPKDEAKRVFYARFGLNPDRVSCTCCGEDYVITEHRTLSEASNYYPKGRKAQELHQFVKRSDVQVIYAKDITAEEREVEVPKQGYVWVE